MIVAAPVQFLRVGQQCEAGLDELGADAQFVVSGAEPFGQVLAASVDVMQLALDLGSRAVGQVAVAEVEQVALLDIEGLQLLGELLVEEPGGSVVVVEHGGELGADFGGEAGVEPHRGVVLLDQLLNVLDADVGCGARGLLLVAFAGAEEVQVFSSPAVLGALDEHAAGAASAVAAAAEQ